MQARFGFDITPTQPTGPCCPDETSTTTTTTTATTTTTTTSTTTGTCTCGLEGTTRIVGGEESTVSSVFLKAAPYPETFSGRKIPVDHVHEYGDN